MTARRSGGAQKTSAAPERGRERSAFGPSLAVSVLLHAGLALLLMTVPVAHRPPRGHAWIEARPAPPPPPPSEPQPAVAPAPEPRGSAEPARRRAPRRERPGAAPAARAPQGGSASPLSGLDSSGPGVPFDMPAETGPKGMAFEPPEEDPGTAAEGPARPPPPIRLDDGTRNEEEVRRIAREVKQGFEAMPHSFAVEKYGGPVARQSTFFPGYGDVPSDLVCRTRDGKWLRTTIPAFDLTVCDRWEVDRSRIDDHTSAPPVVCVESHVQHIEERTLEAPRSYLSHECMQRDPDHWDIDWEKRTVQYRCIRWIDIERENTLTYKAKRFTDSFEEDRGITMRLQIPPCGEPDETVEAPAQPAGEDASARTGG